MSTLTETIPASALFTQAIAEHTSRKGDQLSFLSGLRNSASVEFNLNGFPSTRNEEWKYTSLAPVLKTNLRVADASEPQVLDSAHVAKLTGLQGITIVLENGRVNKTASSLQHLPEGVTIGSFTELAQDTRLAQHLGKYAPIEKEPLAALNSSLFHDGVAIFIAANTVVKESIHVLVTTTSGDALATQPRVLVVAGKNAECVITELHLTNGEAQPHFTNLVAETVCEPGAKLTYVKLQDTDAFANQVNFHQAWLDRDSYLHITTLSLNGALIRNNLHIRLNNQNCTAWLNGLYVLNGKQLVDNHSLVDHAFPNCYSNELYKGIIDDHAQGVFNGKIFVRQDAQKTNAYQSNKNVLLSNNASMNAKPQLEIFADDVKCSHGATTGQMDDDALFYLRARGIGEATARALLNHAFAADVIGQIGDEEIREQMLIRLDRKLNV